MIRGMMEDGKRVSIPPVIAEMISAPSGRPITKAMAIPRGAPPSAIPVARAARPLTPAIRPRPSNITAAATPIISPPIRPSSGMAWGNAASIRRRSTAL